MKITKNLMQSNLDKALNLFNEKILKVDQRVVIDFIEDVMFIDDAREAAINNALIKANMYLDFDKEYATFAVVYPHNKALLLMYMGLPYKISISLDRAKKVLKKESTKDINTYLQYMFLHEIIHLFENDLIEKYTECYQVIKQKYTDDTSAKEMFAEVFPSKYLGFKDIDCITKRINAVVYNRMKKICAREEDKEVNELKTYISYI